MNRIKINGVTVNVVSGFVGGVWFHVDSPENPRVPVAQHHLDRAAAEHIKNGGKVRTSGNVYEKAE